MSQLQARFDIASLAMFCVVLIWAGNNVLAKAALDDRLDPVAYVFGRFLIVSVVLALWLLLRGQLRMIDRSDMVHFAVAGGCGYALSNLLFAVGLKHTTAFASSILTATGPIFMLLIAAAWKLEKIRRAQWIGVLVAFAGAVIFVTSSANSGVSIYGDVLVLASSITFAAFSIATRPLIARYGALFTTFWLVALGWVAMAPFTVITAFEQDWRNLGALGWTSILYAALVSMIVGYTLWGWSLQRSGPGRTAPFLFLIPIVAGFMAWLFLEETASKTQLIGSAFVLAGVFIALRGARPPAAKVSDPEQSAKLNLIGIDAAEG